MNKTLINHRPWRATLFAVLLSLAGTLGAQGQNVAKIEETGTEYSSLQAAFDDAKDLSANNNAQEVTVTLLNEVDLEDYLMVSTIWTGSEYVPANFNLDLAGHGITGSQDNYLIFVGEAVKLEITDNSNGNPRRIYNSGTGCSIHNEGELTIRKGTISGNNGIENWYRLSMDGGTISATTTGISNYNSGFIGFYSGSVESGDVALDNNGTDSYAYISGGEFRSADKCAVYNNGRMIFEGGAYGPYFLVSNTTYPVIENAGSLSINKSVTIQGADDGNVSLSHYGDLLEINEVPDFYLSNANIRLSENAVITIGDEFVVPSTPITISVAGNPDEYIFTSEFATNCPNCSPTGVFAAADEDFYAISNSYYGEGKIYKESSLVANVYQGQNETIVYTSLINAINDATSLSTNNNGEEITVVLNSDVNLGEECLGISTFWDGNVYMPASVCLHLSGHTISGSSVGSLILIDPNGLLTIADTEEEKGGISNTAGGYCIENYGNMVILDGITISGENIGIRHAGTGLTLNSLPQFQCGRIDIDLDEDKFINFEYGITRPTNKVKVEVDNSAPYTFTSGFADYCDGLSPEDVFMWFENNNFQISADVNGEAMVYDLYAPVATLTIGDNEPIIYDLTCGDAQTVLQVALNEAYSNATTNDDIMVTLCQDMEIDQIIEFGDPDATTNTNPVYFDLNGHKISFQGKRNNMFIVNNNSKLKIVDGSTDGGGVFCGKNIRSTLIENKGMLHIASITLRGADEGIYNLGKLYICSDVTIENCKEGICYVGNDQSTDKLILVDLPTFSNNSSCDILLERSKKIRFINSIDHKPSSMIKVESLSGSNHGLEFSFTEDYSTYVTIAPSGLFEYVGEINAVAFLVNGEVQFLEPIQEDNGTVIAMVNGEYVAAISDDNGPATVIDLGDSNEIELASLNYNRTLNAPEDGTVGDKTIDGESAYLYTTCLPYPPATDDGVKYYTLNGVDGTTLTFVEETTPVGRTPYLVAVTSGSIDEGNSITTDVTLSKEVDATTTAGNYVMKGTLTGLTNEEAAAAGAYILQDGGTWGLVTTSNPGAYIPPFRAYIVSTSGARLLSSSFGGQTTGIDSIRTKDADGTERWYDLNGRRIDKPLQKGVYIHNGKKVANK